MIFIGKYKGNLSDKVDNTYVATDQVTPEQEQGGELQVIFENGKLIKEYSLEEVRKNVDASL